MVETVARNSDILHGQVKAYGAVTAEAITQLEARLKALEAGVPA